MFLKIYDVLKKGNFLWKFQAVRKTTNQLIKTLLVADPPKCNLTTKQNQPNQKRTFYITEASHEIQNPNKMWNIVVFIALNMLSKKAGLCNQSFGNASITKIWKWLLICWII